MDPELIKLLVGLRIDLLCSSQRFAEFDQKAAYLRGTQYSGRRYDWDGALVGYAGDIPIQSGTYVPMSARRPSVRRDLPKLIVSRLTSMGFGREQWPDLKIPGDSDAEDAARYFAECTDLPARIIEARTKGGASGTVCASYGFVDGKPRIKIHEAKHCHVLRWRDRDEFLVEAAIKVYRYQRGQIIDGRLKQVDFYSVRYWDSEREITWDPIPDSIAKSGQWAQSIRSYVSVHGYGECPFFWCQNLPDSETEDGASDYDGMLSRFDAINQASSANNKGVVANVDPTLVIKSEQAGNKGVVRTGSDVVIYSSGGAEYLELEGSAVRTASEWIDKLSQWCLDEAGVVLADPQTIAARAQSGEALKVIYMPMAAQCDVLRGQYGRLIVRLLVGLLNAARRIVSSPPGAVVTTADGRRIQTVPTVVLEPRYVEKTSVGEDGLPVKTFEAVERSLGASSSLSLNWRSYFPPTPADIKSATEAATTAEGKLVASKTAIAYTSSMFGVKDVDAEAIQIEAERQLRNESAPGPDDLFGRNLRKGKSEKDDDEEDDSDDDNLED